MLISITPLVEKFYKDNFAILICKTDSQEVKLSKNKTIIVKGYMPKLEKGRKYNADVEEVNDKKWGIQYKVKHLQENIPTTISEEKEYLKIMLTGIQVEEIYRVYPEGGIIELIENGEFDYRQVKGLGEVLYNKVKKKLMDNIIFQKALVELSKYGITYKMVMKLMKKYEYTEIVLKKIKENPYILADEVSGISFIKCDIYALNMGIEKESELRINACIKYLLKEDADNNGNSWMFKNDVIDRGVKLLEIDRELIVDYVKSVDNNDIIDDVDSFEEIFGDKKEKELKGIWTDQNRIALKKNWEYEHNIYCKLQELINTECDWCNIEEEDIDKKINEIEQEEKIEQNNEDFTFTDQQKESIKLAVKNNVLIINGPAGTGKSQILKAILKIFNTPSYATCALSGKAVQRIKELGLDSYTIHRLLKYKRNQGFMYNKKNKLDLYIVALDETSMVSSDLAWRLIQAISNGSKLILLGDIEQLEPINCGFVLRDLINNVPTITLTKIHRQAEKSGIITVASKIRKGEVVERKGVYGELKDFFLYPYLDKEVMYNQIIKMCQGYKKRIDNGNGDIMDLQVLVPMKEKGLCTKRLNRDLQNVFNGIDINNVDIDDIDSIRLKFGEKEFRVKDKIIQNGNNYEKGIYEDPLNTVDIYNGTMGRILDIYEGKLLIDFDGVIVEYSGEDLLDIDLAYAITIHRFQGSACKNVILGLDNSNYIMLSKQLIYTGITRAIESCIVICEMDAWKYGIGRNRGERKSFLREMFEGEGEERLVG